MYGFSFPDVLIPCHSNKLLRLKSELRGEEESASAPLTAKKNFTNALFPLSYQQISTSSIPIQLAPALSQEWRCIVFLGAAWENVTKHEESSRKSALTSVTVKHCLCSLSSNPHSSANRMDLGRTAAACSPFEEFQTWVLVLTNYFWWHRCHQETLSLYEDVLFDFHVLHGLLTYSCAGLLCVDCPV